MFERVLVPLDGSKLGELALPYAESLAFNLHSEVSLLKILESTEGEYRRPFEIYLEDVSARIRKGYGETNDDKVPIKINAVVTEGHHASGIIDFAEKNNIGLIVLTSHGRSGLMPWTIGGVASKVIQDLRIPVLLVRATNPVAVNLNEELFENVLIPLDGSKTSESVIPFIKELAFHIQMNVTLLQVVSSEENLHNIGGLDHFSIPERILERMKLEARKYLEKTQADFENTKATMKWEIRSGNAANEILKICDERNIRLVAMSNHGHSAIERWTLGSVSNKVIHSGKTPVLLVKAIPGT
jgi:nucleotide-binding universal stress UspA family protein